MQTDLAILKQLVIETAKKSPLSERVQGVELESDRDNDGAEYLRVMIRVKNVAEPDYAALSNLLEAIESAVGERDDRYPSVRFPDAA